MVTRTADRVFSDLAVPPGELLAEELEARGMTQKELADRTGRPEQKISEIINGRKSITHDTALELEKVLGVSADFWVNLEASYQLTRARLRERSELERQEDWLDFFPVSELRRRGYIPKGGDNQQTLAALLKFFGVASFQALQFRQLAVLENYRITPKSKVDEGALWAWLCEGTIEARKIATEPYDQRRFLDVLSEIRPLTTEPVRDSVPKAMELSASAGVAFVVVKEFPRGGASGVARWLSPDKAMIQLSTKRRWIDIFWFSFYHEAKHVLDRQKRRAIVNGVNEDPEAEEAANQFAMDTLIPPDEWASFVGTGDRTAGAVKSFARSVGVAAGIVVGRLQHERLVSFQNLNSLRNRIVWSDD